MKKSNYSYFFDLDTEYVGYSWLTNSFISYDIECKKKIERILGNPEEIVTNLDTAIYKELIEKMFLIPRDYSEYNYLLKLRKQNIYSNDKLQLTICPTMACNLRCTYCYEIHPSLKESKIGKYIDALKKLINNRIAKLNYLSIAWFGGEPLYSPQVVMDFSAFCKDLCMRHNVKFTNSMSTNFTLANKEIIEHLSKNNLNFIQITLDGYKENHDQKRITINNKPTYDRIVKNIKIYLNTNNQNRIALRMHLPNGFDQNYINKTIESLNNSFDKNLRSRITVYHHILFESRTDSWQKKDNTTEISNKRKKELNALLDKFRKEVYLSGYKTSLFNKKLYYCEADLNYFWTVRPDGYLTKCTVALEKERAQARLTEEGNIKNISNNLLDFNCKEYSGKILDYCKDCKYLPLCWYGCGFSLTQSNNIEENFEKTCMRNKGTWILNRTFDDIKYLYLEQKRKIENEVR